MPHAIDTARQALTTALRSCGVTGDDWRIYLLGYEVQIQRTGVYRAYVAVRLSENVNRRYALSLYKQHDANTWFVAAGPFIADESQMAAKRVRALLEARAG